MAETIDIIVETPGGSAHKYDYDPKAVAFRLNKKMPAGMVFPFDFGFIPGTLGQDGDPLDVVVLGDAPTFTGCVIACRIIGCIQAEQTERDGSRMRNDRYIGITETTDTFSNINNLKELPGKLIKELEDFFTIYNSLSGKHFKVLKRISGTAAIKMIRQSMAKDTVNTRLELMLPVSDADGKKFPQKRYDDLQAALLKQFGGLTTYSKTPVNGYWKPDKKIRQQPVIVYELLLPVFEPHYWKTLKKELEKKFRQTEIIITHAPCSKI